MKQAVFAKSTLALSLAVVLSGCGQGESLVTPSTSVNGVAVDGLLSGMFCYADINNNEVFDNGTDVAANALTGVDGAFTITGVGVASSNIICRAEAGATDQATGETFVGQFSSPAGSSVVSPMTTMVVALGGDDAAKTKVKSLFNLPNDVDPLANPLENSDLARAATQVQVVVKQMKNALVEQIGGNLTTAQQNAILKASFEAFADSVQDKSSEDLQDDTELESVLATAFNSLTRAITGLDFNDDAASIATKIRSDIDAVATEYSGVDTALTGEALKAALDAAQSNSSSSAKLAPPTITINLTINPELFEVDDSDSTISSEPFDGGLLTNGDFSSTETGWSGNAFNVQNGVNYANVETAGNPWDVNLSHVLELTAGNTYTLSFKAKGTDSRTILAGVGLNEEPYTNVTETVTLSSEWQTFTYTFEAIGFGSVNSRVLFDMGADVGEVFIDNVVLISDSSEETPDGDTTGGDTTGGNTTSVELPVNFENELENYTFDSFGNAEFALAEDPDDTNNQVLKMTRKAGTDWWSGGVIEITSVDATSGVFTLKVYSTIALDYVELKLEQDSNNVVIMNASHSGSGWETLTFSVADGVLTGSPVAATKAVITPRVTNVAAEASNPESDQVFYFDALTYVESIPEEAPTPTYKLVWSNEFDDNSLSNWVIETGYGPNDDGWGNQEIQNYTPDNVTVVDGNLKITASCDTDIGSCNSRDGSVTSARLTTKDKVEFRYGKIEARMKVPSGTSTWPALWMLGASFPDTAWPDAGEIDIMEVWQTGGASLYNSGSTLHYSLDGSHVYETETGMVTDLLSNDFHVWTMEWDESSIKFAIDDVEVNTFDITDGKYDAFRQPFFLLANLAINGTLGGEPDQILSTPQEFLIDYVRLYQDEANTDSIFTLNESLSLTVKAENANAVRMTGPWWGWDPAGGPVASDNGDGTWTVTLDSIPTENMEYLWVVDGVQENIVDNDPADFSCTPVTDYANYANRQWTVGAGDVSGDIYDSCTIPLTLTVSAANAEAVRMTGPWWGWDPAGGPIANSNGDGTWTVTLPSVPTENMEYLWVVDGVQENIVDNDPADFSCTPVTDYANYANRQWTVGAGDVSGDIYDSCTIPLTLTVSVANAEAVRMTGPWWGWDPAGGPVANSNGDGTWTVTLPSVPTENMEYLWVMDGVQENIVDNDPADFSCTPVTDYANYANRQWTVGSDNVSGDIYDSCK